MKYIIPILLSLLILSCDEGIGPAGSTEPTGFSGTITFIGDWPAGITRTHIVMFKNPLNNASDFSFLNIKYVSLEIPYGSETFEYNTTESAFLPESGYLAAEVYSYLAVAQSTTVELLLDRSAWFVAGLYYAEGDSTRPGTVTVSSGVILENVDITCNFNDPPPQPPGGN